MQVACVDECGSFFGRSPLQATLLRLRTARDAVGAWEVGDTEVKENREVRSLVPRCKTKISMVELVAADVRIPWRFSTEEHMILNLLEDTTTMLGWTADTLRVKTSRKFACTGR